MAGDRPMCFCSESPMDCPACEALQAKELDASEHDIDTCHCDDCKAAALDDEDGRRVDEILLRQTK